MFWWGRYGRLVGTVGFLLDTRVRGIEGILKIIMKCAGGNPWGCSGLVGL